MSFTNVETESAGFRVIFTDHTIPASATQLPDPTEAYLTEGMGGDQQGVHDLLENGWFAPQTVDINDHYDVVWHRETGTAEFRAFAKQHVIPLVALEPLMDLHHRIGVGHDYRPEPDIFERPDLIPGKVIEKAIFTLRLNTEMPRSGVIFRYVDRNNRETERGNPILHLRNLLMAEMAVAFAETYTPPGSRQRLPWYAIGAGFEHTGIVRALELPVDERVRLIREDPLFHSHYPRKSRYKGAVSIYDAEQGVWDRYTFANSRLI